MKPASINHDRASRPPAVDDGRAADEQHFWFQGRGRMRFRRPVRAGCRLSRIIRMRVATSVIIA